MEQLFCKESFSAFCKKEASQQTMSSGTFVNLKRCKTEGCSSKAGNLLNRVSWQNPSSKFSECFETLLRNLIKSSFSVALKLVSCKSATPAKSEITEVSGSFWKS